MARYWRNSSEPYPPFGHQDYREEEYEWSPFIIPSYSFIHFIKLKFDRALYKRLVESYFKTQIGINKTFRELMKYGAPDLKTWLNESILFDRYSFTLKDSETCNMYKFTRTKYLNEEECQETIKELEFYYYNGYFEQDQIIESSMNEMINEVKELKLNFNKQ